MSACIYLDDILVSGRTKEHIQSLDAVLAQRVNDDAGLWLKQKKCAFIMESVEYLGHQISAEELHPIKEKFHALTDAPPPQDDLQLQAFLGLINCYAKFLPQVSSTLAPLYQLQAQWKHFK